jgi:hypothetical protein|eukprot:COSAG01_NODE_215_length_21709_cov_141.101217_36_plen_54_part_00
MHALRLLESQFLEGLNPFTSCGHCGLASTSQLPAVGLAPWQSGSVQQCLGVED